MRSTFVLCACLLTACSTQAVRCERHLTPINVPQRPFADAPASSRPGNADAHIPSAPQAGRRVRATGEADPVAPKPAPGPESSP